MTVRVFGDSNDWQVRETRAALKEADPGDFAHGTDVIALATDKR